MARTVAKLMDNLTSAFTADFERNYVDPVTTPHPTNVAKYMQAFTDGAWEVTQTNIDDFFRVMHLPTMFGKNLDIWAQVVNLERRAGESDAEYRIRIYGAVRRRFAGTNANAIIEFTAAVIGASPSDITYRENCYEAGDPYCPAEFTIEFNLAILGPLGFAPSEYQSAVDVLNEVLTDMSAAGVRGQVLFTGGAEYDVDDYDTAEDIYGS